MLVKHSFRPANEIVRRVEVSSDEADGGKPAFWSLVVGYLIESFALYAASMHPVGLFPVEPAPERQNMPQPTQLSPRQRRVVLTLVSTTAAVGSAGDSPREHEIKKAVAALAELDDRTLRELGIPHRSHIERTVRYCHDC